MHSGSSAPPWVTTAVLALCGMAVALQFTLVIPLLGDLPLLLGVSEEGASWLITATLLTSAVSTPIVARAADMYGKRRMLLVALGALALGSLIAAVGTSFVAVLVGRSLQGFASSLVAVGISLLRDELPAERISSALALMSATVGVGSALGLPLAGLLTDAFGWHAIFWFTAAFAVLLALGLMWLVPESKLRTPGRFDFVGAAVLSVALVAILIPITQASSWGWFSPAVLALLFLGSLALGAWVPLELRIDQPMVDLRTAARRPVLLTNAATLFVGFTMFVNMLVTIRQLELPKATGYGMGLEVLATGLAMVPTGLGMVAISPVSGWLLDRFGGRATLLVGTAIMALSYLGRVFFSESVAQIVVGAMLVGIGIAIAFAAMPTLIMATVPITETAAANGLNTLVRALGAAIASAMVTVVFRANETTLGGQPVTGRAGLELAVWFAVAASFVALVIGWSIPARPVPARVRKMTPAGAGEMVVGGRVVRPDHTRVTTPAIVMAFDLEGRQLDWARADHQGRYSVALPGPGSYVVVANAQGWAPAAHVLDLASDTADQLLGIVHELTLSGTVTQRGRACPGAVVTLSVIEGDQVASTTCDELGQYSFPLPPIGRYLVTAFYAPTGTATAYKTLLAVDSQVIHLRLDH